MTTRDYKKIADAIPDDPGVYRFLDTHKTILYVGKAKNLKKRISSYFGDKKNQAFKTRTMVRHADHIEFTIVDNEHDALLLENTLIKKHQPRYNVMLKDGKSYAYICIKKEPFPRVFFTRKIIKDGSIYFGPYTSKYRANILFEVIKSLFKLRTCSYNLSNRNIEKKRFKECLEYHIKNCNAPCVGMESEQEYNEKIAQVKNILKGNFKQVKAFLENEMQSYVEELKFEKAHEIKNKLASLDNYQSKSTVVSVSIKDVDVFSIRSFGKSAFVNYLKVIDGVLIHAETLELEKNLNEDEADLLGFIIPIIREKYQSIAPEVILPFEVIMEDQALQVTIPKRGDKKALLVLSQKNVTYHILQRKKEEINKIGKQSSTERILHTLRVDLNMKQTPLHIECFDNSNIQGTNPTASCVVFKNGKPSKADYRHFKVKTVEGPDDFASMREIVYRRYKRLLEENQGLPDLIIIDGGKGQLSAAVDSLTKLDLMGKITVVGIAKKLEEIYFPNDSVPLHINKKSESLKIIQQARDEAHRFALALHRNIRSKKALGTKLTDIPGVGEKTARKLLSKFRSVQRIKLQSIEVLTPIIGASMAKKIYSYFHPFDEEE